MRLLKGKQNKLGSSFIRCIPLYIMMLPAITYFIINNYIPMLYTFIAFKDVDFRKGFWKSDWVGLTNFKFFINSPDFWTITKNTVIYNLIFIVVNTVVAIAVAIFLSKIRSKVFLKFNQTIVLMPHLISMVIVSYVVYAFLSMDTGFINNSILKPLGIDPIGWYSTPRYWRVILPIVSVWKTVGYLSIIYYASIIGIDNAYFECAQIDGASEWNQITKITIPMIRQTIIVLTLINIGKIFSSDFGLFYQVPMDSGAIYETTNVITTYVYRALVRNMDIGMSAAAGLYQSSVGFILVVLTNAIVKKVDESSVLF